MFEKIKSLFKKKPFLKKEEIIEKKEIILCVHGFGHRQQHEFDNFQLWNQDKYKLVTFDIYNLKDEKDCNPIIWIKRCEGMIESYLNSGYTVSLLGFSMGGVLATHLASKYPVKRLFLISPAFDYLHVGNIMNTAVNKFRKPATAHKAMPSNFTSCFMEVVRLCKDAINSVDCPIWFVHGDKDEVIPLRSSINAYEKAKSKQKRLLIIHEGKHRMMLRENSAWECWQLFQLFMDDVLLPSNAITFAEDIK